MENLNLDEINEFVNNNIVRFHKSKINSLEKLKLKDILKKKNPYLFKAKNITLAHDLVINILDAFLSSSEEKIFGDFLEELARFIVFKTFKGHKSSATGIDIEFIFKDIRYLISVKSGPNWGNSSQWRKLREDFDKAVRVLKQAKHTINVQPVLGICYGKNKTTYLNNFMKVVGQNFWYLISGNENLYTDIIEPLGYKAREHNAEFLRQKEQLVNLFTQQFLHDFCEAGRINWKRVVEFNSGNLDLNL